LSGDNLSLSVKNRFEHPSFLLEAKQKQLQEILQNVAGGISLVTMNANVSGSWDKFHIDVDSNLGKALSDGFQKQLQAKLGDAKAKLDAFVKDKVEPAKKKAEAQLAALAGGPAKALGQEKSAMNSALKGAEGSAKGGSGGSALDKGKNLLKGFGL
jgi:hypothetical protein